MTYRVHSLVMFSVAFSYGICQLKRVLFLVLVIRRGNNDVDFDDITIVLMALDVNNARSSNF